jgi:hypothetical protein
MKDLQQRSGKRINRCRAGWRVARRLRGQGAFMPTTNISTATHWIGGGPTLGIFDPECILVIQSRAYGELKGQGFYVGCTSGYVPRLVQDSQGMWVLVFAKTQCQRGVTP